MAAITTISTSPGYGTAPWPATRRRVPSGAIPQHGHRVPPTSRATYRRRRLAVTTSALAGLALVGAMAGVALGGSPLAAPERRPASVSTGPARAAAGAADAAATVVVHAGDTLWSIVSRLAPADDPRPLVDELSDARDGAPLQVGERIALPR
jgi:hypothetical protein